MDMIGVVKDELSAKIDEMIDAAEELGIFEKMGIMEYVRGMLRAWEAIERCEHEDSARFSGDFRSHVGALNVLESEIEERLGLLDRKDVE